MPTGRLYVVPTPVGNLEDMTFRAIRVLKELGMLESLPAKLQQAAAAREKNPEASLTELAAMMEPPITKPAMNHRLKKLVAMAQEEFV